MEFSGLQRAFLKVHAKMQKINVVLGNANTCNYKSTYELTYAYKYRYACFLNKTRGTLNYEAGSAVKPACCLKQDQASP